MGTHLPSCEAHLAVGVRQNQIFSKLLSSRCHGATRIGQQRVALAGSRAPTGTEPNQDARSP